MGNDFTSSLRPAIVMTILFALLLGFAYPLALDRRSGRRSFPWPPTAAWSATATKS